MIEIRAGFSSCPISKLLPENRFGGSQSFLIGLKSVLAEILGNFTARDEIHNFTPVEI